MQMLENDTAAQVSKGLGKQQAGRDALSRVSRAHTISSK